MKYEINCTISEIVEIVSRSESTGPSQASSIMIPGKLSDKPSQEVDTIFTPFSFGSELKVDSDELVVEETAFDHFN